MKRDGGPTRRVGAFIFDLDGTLVDSGADIALSANHMRATLGLPELPLPVVLGFVGDGAPMLVRRLLAHPARPGEAPPAVDDDTVRGAWRCSRPIMPGTVSTRPPSIRVSASHR